MSRLMILSVLILNLSPGCSDVPLPPLAADAQVDRYIDPNIDNDKDGYTPSQGDCNDNDKDVYPGQKEEIYNGKDDDCDQTTPDDDLDGDGYDHLTGEDCNDNDKSIHPGATEIEYDGIDQDCKDGDLNDLDNDGYPGEDAIGVNGTDCNDNDSDINPGAAEIPYDSIDQNCDKELYIKDGATTLYTANGIDPIFDVAASDTHFLVTWKETGANQDTIKAQLYTHDGTPDGYVMDIGVVFSNLINQPVVASNKTDFLVAWVEFVTDGPTIDNYYIRTRQVKSSTGITSTSNRSIEAPSSIADVPMSLSFGLGGYALAWTDESQKNAYLTQLKVDGSMNGTNIFSMTTTHEMNMLTLSAEQNSPYLLTWYQENNGTNDIFGRIINASGTAPNPAFTISSASNNQQNPRTVLGQTDFLSVWHDNRISTNLNIYGQAIDTLGNLVKTTVTDNIPISTATGTQGHPIPLYCNGKFSIYFVDRQFSDIPIISRQQLSTSYNHIANPSQNTYIYANTDPVEWSLRAVCGNQSEIITWIEANTIRAMFVPF